MENKKLLIGAGVVVVAYLLWKKSKSKPQDLRSQEQKDCEKEGRSWDSVEKFCGMKNTQYAMPMVESEWLMLSKIPNEFTVKSNGFNTRYYKNIDKSKTGFASQFSVPELYKQSYSTTGDSGVMPTKISVREFSDAYSVFLKQPK